MDDMDDLSDLTDEEEVPLAKSSRRSLASLPDSPEKDHSYRIQGALKAPRPTSYTTQALFEQMTFEDIDLDADYQRGVVWPDSKQIALVDSIFRNFYVPPLIFAVVWRDDASERRICIDGKQRLTSIRRFMSGEIYYKDVFTNEKFVFQDIGKYKHAQKLPEKYVKIFNAKQIVCIEYTDLTDANEREIFQRVQLGMALTPAEKLQAISSPMATFVREIQHQYVQDGLAEYLVWDTGRGTDFRCIAHAVYNMERWPNLASVPGVTTLQKLLQREEEIEPKLQNQIHQTFSIFLALAQDKKHRKAFVISDIKKISPAEFIAIATLIHVHKFKLTNTQLAEAIRNMRIEVRKIEKDIRMNSRCMKTLLDFVRELKTSSLTPDPSGVAAAKNVPLKRKRVEENDDDEEALVEPKKRAAAPKREPSTALTASQAHAASTSSATPPPIAKSSVTLPLTSKAEPVSPDLDALPQHHNDRLAAVRHVKAASESFSRGPPSEPAADRHGPATSAYNVLGPPPSFLPPRPPTTIPRTPASGDGLNATLKGRLSSQADPYLHRTYVEDGSTRPPHQHRRVEAYGPAGGSGWQQEAYARVPSRHEELFPAGQQPYAAQYERQDYPPAPYVSQMSPDSDGVYRGRRY